MGHIIKTCTILDENNIRRWKSRLVVVMCGVFREKKKQFAISKISNHQDINYVFLIPKRYRNHIFKKIGATLFIYFLPLYNLNTYL